MVVGVREEVRDAVMGRIPARMRGSLASYPMVKKSSEKECLFRIGIFEFQCQSILKAARMSKKSVKNLVDNIGGETATLEMKYVIIISVATPLVLLVITVSLICIVRRRRRMCGRGQLIVQMGNCDLDTASTSSNV